MSKEVRKEGAQTGVEATPEVNPHPPATVAPAPVADVMSANAPIGGTGTIPDNGRPGWTPAQTPAKRFLLPKIFPTEAEFLSLPAHVPLISVNRLALYKMHIIVGLINMEVGWLGTARRNETGIIVDDVFLFEQDVSHGHSELTSDSMSQIMQEVLKRPDGEEIFNNTRFWGHSHGNGDTYPSGQDNDTMKTFEGFGADFFLRAILNRQGKISFSLYDWQKGIAFHEAPWQPVGAGISVEEDKRLCGDLLTEMVEKVVYQPPFSASPAGQGMLAAMFPYLCFPPVGHPVRRRRRFRVK